MDYSKPIEIEKGVYWVGYNFETIFRTNPYLIVDGEEGVLIDPGSMFDFEIVRDKIKDIIPLHKIRHIILHHQDPDLCGSTAAFELISGKNIHIYNPKRSSYFMKFYGIKNPINAIDENGYELILNSGRVLKFFMTPYCHSPGAMITFDEKSGSVFTSDIFGAFNKKWRLYADEVGEELHLETIRNFMEPFMGSREAMMNVVDILNKLPINKICPQHGSIIRTDIKKWIFALTDMKYGKALREKPDWFGGELPMAPANNA